ncbi:WD40 repeat-like protein [Dacryopinax primogenitus]|uniref:WD40 repeat-like protein n=1 Tax=Dacryopinax primogenitus (strain DJM 731) TaxID=1858805 RepID=M5GBA2_DACPD|nr:WD40 repeat-like protein [Dacryopinax primogenitus]EJU06204.1 WD40 repeat-like protein [Dacryopinax primogenitus]
MVAAESPREARRRLSASLGARSLWHSLDRTQVLGNGGYYGHSGCVNALSWSSDGQTLLSGGDDRTIAFWRMQDDTGELSLKRVIQTGHTANIFNAQFLPDSPLIATCAGDSEVRVFDIEHSKGLGELRRADNGHTWEHSGKEALVRVFKCHSRRTKRIIPESASNFLSVSQDGTVRQHDLRMPHTCRTGCPPPLIKVPHQLFAISRSSLTPYYFVVAGSSPYAHLFDRRMIPRLLEDEWGVQAQDDELAQAVRRFGRRTIPTYEKARDAHVTGTRMAESNGHELLLSYSGDAIYLYSIYDDVEDTSFAPNGSNIVARSPKRRRTEPKSDEPHSAHSANGVSSEQRAHDVSFQITEPEEADSGDLLDVEDLVMDIDMDEEDLTDIEEELFEASQTLDTTKSDLDGLRTVMPRRTFRGICNIETVKDVNFLGPNDEFVASGSDDGSFFIWDKRTSRVEGIYEGDGSVVNVIEQNPFRPMVAVSGIDHTVKIFSPVPSTTERKYSRVSDAEDIMRQNTQRAEAQANAPAVPLMDVLIQMYAARGGRNIVIGEGGERECQIQ